MINNLFGRFFAVFTVAWIAVSPGTAAVKKKVPVPAHRSSSKKIASHKSSSKAVTSGGRRKGVTSTVQTWRNRQAAPSSDRYREIQQALLTKGYLKSQPNGVWDTQSAEAMKQFQTDQKLSPSGKINSASLIGLGLGPKHNPVPSTNPAAPTAGESPLTP